MIQEEEDALDSIEDAAWEIYNQGKDEYFGFEDRVKEALIDERQKEISKTFPNDRKKVFQTYLGS